MDFFSSFAIEEAADRTRWREGVRAIAEGMSWCIRSPLVMRKKQIETGVNLKTGRFDNINSAVIISSVCKAVQNCKSSAVYARQYKTVRIHCTKLQGYIAYTADDDS